MSAFKTEIHKRLVFVIENQVARVRARGTDWTKTVEGLTSIQRSHIDEKKLLPELKDELSEALSYSGHGLPLGLTFGVENGFIAEEYEHFLIGLTERCIGHGYSKYKFVYGTKLHKRLVYDEAELTVYHDRDSVAKCVLDVRNFRRDVRFFVFNIHVNDLRLALFEDPDARIRYPVNQSNSDRERKEIHIPLSGYRPHSVTSV